VSNRRLTDAELVDLFRPILENTRVQLLEVAAEFSHAICPTCRAREVEQFREPGSDAG
jgi:hypothetical protein